MSAQRETHTKTAFAPPKRLLLPPLRDTDFAPDSKRASGCSAQKTDCYPLSAQGRQDLGTNEND